MLLGMLKVQTDIRNLGHLAAMHELLRLGNSQASIRSAVGRGAIIRVRKGWYCLPTLGTSFQAAARVGGRLSCVSLAEAVGLWIPSGNHGLHVAVPPDATQLRSAVNYHDRLKSDSGARVVVHWDDVQNSGNRYSTDLPSALLRTVSCLGVESSFVLCESALFRRALTSSQWGELLASAPLNVRAKLRAASRFSESGTESLFRFRSEVFRVRVQQQVWLGPDRVDFLLGDRLVVEIDSVAHHDPTEDAKRDARLSVLGYRVLRFMYSQVVGDWKRVEAAILAAISRGDHLAN
jgi:very-short-patch-repair endonuclease